MREEQRDIEKGSGRKARSVWNGYSCMKAERQGRRHDDGDGKRNGACVGVEPGAKSQVAKRYVMSSDLQFHYRLPPYR